MLICRDGDASACHLYRFNHRWRQFLFSESSFFTRNDLHDDETHDIT